MTSDLDLLRRFARENSQDAFTEIVRRHVNLVYSAALRQVRSPQLAEEIAQSVFADLARDAGKLKADTILTAWLYAVTRRTAIDAIRKESRRQLREQIAAEINNANQKPHFAKCENENMWSEIEPLLDDAMAALDETDRSAILLRYFENKNLREVGESLKISDDAAQKRVSRAVKRLREFFSKQKITIGVSGLAVLISANAVQSAPVGLAATISAAAVLAGTAVHTSTLIAATKIIAMTTLQKTLVATALTAAIGTGIYEAYQAAQLQNQIQTIQQQQAPLAERIRQLQQEHDDATNQLAGLLAENVQLKSNSDENELLKLRGEVTQKSLRVKTLMDDPFVQSALEWETNESELRKLFDERPDQRIPEMQFLTDRQWLDIARDADLDSKDGIRLALGTVRNHAQQAFADMMRKALNKYTKANNGNLPDNPFQLKPFFDTPVDDAVLQRYEALNNEAPQPAWAKGAVFVEKPSAVIDKWEDPAVSVGPVYIGISPTPAPVHLTFPKELIPAMQAYQSNNNGKSPKDFSELKPFVTTPEQEAALENLITTINQAKAP